MNTHTPKIALIAIILLMTWAAPAPGGDQWPGNPGRTELGQDMRPGQEAVMVARNDDPFRLDDRGRRGEDPFRLDGGRSNDHLFRLDGNRRGRDGRGDDRIRHDDRWDDKGRKDDWRRDDHRRDDRRRDDRWKDNRRKDGRGDGRRGSDSFYRDDGRRLPGHFSTPPERFDRRGEYRNIGRDFGRGRDYRVHEKIEHRHVRRVVYDIPRRHAVILHGRDRYHFHGGRYYRPWNSGYILVRPPLGLVVLSLPLGSRTVLSAGFTYHVYGDVYYRQVPAGYMVVDPVRVPARDWPERVSVVTDLLNIRYGPDEREEIIAQAGRYTVLKVLGSAPGWLYVEIDGENVRGWVMERYVSADLGRG